MTSDQLYNDDVPRWFTGSEYTHRVARAIAQYGPIARTTLAQMLGLSQGALSRITADLIYAGVIEELSQLPASPTESETPQNPRIPAQFAAKSTSERRGRPQTALQLRCDQVSFLGANLHGQEIIMTQMDALCRPLGESITEPLRGYAPDEVAQQIADMTKRYVAQNRAKNPNTAPVATLGVSVGGHHKSDRYVTYAPFMRWNGEVDFGGMLEQYSGLPSAVFNDIDSLLLREGWFGAAVGIDRFAVLTIGAGVGYSLAIDGQAVDDPDKSFGLTGHIPLDFTGPRCSSGHVGCSASLTTDSIVNEYAAMVGHMVTYEQFVADARAFVPAAVKLGGKIAYRLGTLIAIVANIAMPKKVIVSGEGSFLAAMFIEEIRAGISSYRHSQTRPVDFEILDFRWSDWAEAAAARAIARYIG